jgi:hypothetical protein
MDNSFDVKLARLETAFHAHKEATQTALKLQAKEYDRRMEILNGHYDRVESLQARSVARELFDITVANLRGDIQAIKSWQDGWIGRNSIVIALVALVSAILGGWFVRWMVS